MFKGLKGFQPKRGAPCEQQQEKESRCAVGFFHGITRYPPFFALPVKLIFRWSFNVFSQRSMFFGDVRIFSAN